MANLLLVLKSRFYLSIYGIGFYVPCKMSFGVKLLQLTGLTCSGLFSWSVQKYEFAAIVKSIKTVGFIAIPFVSHC